MTAAPAPASVPAAIVSRDLTKAFGQGEARTIAVNKASFTAAFGEILYLVGPSGSGKTTLLSIVSGILRPDSGDVRVDGVDIWALRPDDLAEFRLRRIGFVFQDYHLFPRLTSAENVAIPLILKGEPWAKSLQAARRALEVVGLQGRADIAPVKLSGGEQQRVAIARAIVAEPDILILDEPTASLDGDTGRSIISFVRQHVLNPRRAILIVTHDARIFEFADAVLHMEDGRVASRDGPGEHLAETADAA